MEDTSAVLDAPELEAEEVETEGGEPSQESSEGESQESTEQETQDEPSIIEADGKLKLSGKALETLNKLKAENPKQAKEFRAALFDAATLRKEFPEGIREAVQLKQWRDELGGEEAVDELKTTVDEFKGLDADFQSGSPKFVDDIAAGNPQAFAQHGPRMMSKFAEIASESFTHEVAKVFASDMAANDVVMQGRMLENVIFDESGKVRQGMEAAARQWVPIAQYIQRISNLAKTAPKTEAKPNEAKTGDVDQREQNLTIREFTTERNAVKSAITEAEFKKNLGNRKLPGDKISTIQELYESALNRAVQATPKHKETVDRYVAAKDRTGYRKYMDGVIRKHAATAMSAAFRRAGVGDKPGPKAVAKPAATTTAATTVATGFNRVGSKPNSNEVDWQATARIAGKKGGDGKYILRDGSKVLFQR